MAAIWDKRAARGRPGSAPETFPDPDSPGLAGSLTVYMCMMLSVICVLLMAIMESARYAVSRTRVQTVTDMGLMSVFAEYNRELLNRYDLYYIDTSYGGSHPSTYTTGEHMKAYMDENFDLPDIGGLIGLGSFTALRTGSIFIKVPSFASDQGGRVYKRQAIHALKDHYGISLIEDVKTLIEDYDSSGIADMDVDEARIEVEEELDGIDLDVEDCPVNTVFDERAGILDVIVDKKNMELSDKEPDLKGLVSYRKNDEGSGLIRASESPDSMSNELLFDEYLCWKFGSYVRPSEGPCGYELEYILEGKGSDAANLKALCGKLLMLREAADTMAVFADEGKREQAKLVGGAAALVLMNPELEEPIADMVLFAWGFAEAVLDVRTLLSGGRVPLVKGEDDWNIKMAGQLPFFLTKNVNTEKEGQSYMDYLRLFLFLEDKTDKAMRSMDMIELNIRQTEGNRNFRMDACVEYLQAEVCVESSSGWSFDIRREYAYEPVVE